MRYWRVYWLATCCEHKYKTIAISLRCQSDSPSASDVFPVLFFLVVIFDLF